MSQGCDAAQADLRTLLQQWRNSDVSVCRIWRASIPGGGGKAVQRGRLLSQVLVRDAKSAAIRAPSPLISSKSGR